MEKRFLLIYFSFFAFHSFAQTWLWGKQGIGLGYGHSVAVDKYENVYFSGYFLSDDTLNFSDSILINPPHNPSGNSIFLTKFDSSGTLLWARQSINYGNVDFGNGGIVATDNSDNAYVNATYVDTVVIGSDTFSFPSRLQSYYLAKYNSNGTFRWASSPILNSRDTSGITSNYISTDPYGNVFATGLFNADTVHFGSQYILGNKRVVFSFLVKYDSNGTVLWANASIGHSYQYNEGDGMCVANDRLGNTYITGAFEDSIWFGSNELITIPPHYFGDAFLTKYSPNGAVLWAKQARIPNANCESLGEALVTDASGNIYVAGHFLDTVEFGTFILKSHNIYPTSQSSIFLIKYDSTGAIIWAKEGEVLDSNSWDIGSLSIDKYKHLYFSGKGGAGHCKVAFGNDTLSINDTAKYDAASIIVEFDSNGTVLCSSIAGGGGWYTNSISSDTSGHFVYFGSAAGTVMFFRSDTITPFSFHNTITGTNYSPFLARWQSCDTDTVTIVSAEEDNRTNAKVYPNPNNGIFTVVCHSEHSEESRPIIEIYNVLGEKVYNATLKQVQGDNTINLMGQPNGVYFYRVLNERGTVLGDGKLIITK